MKELLKALAAASTKVIYRGDTVILDRRQWEVIEELCREEGGKAVMKELKKSLTQSEV